MAWHVTLPSLASIIVLMFILRVSNIFQVGFDRIFMFATGLTCSHEQLLMDEAISAFSRRITRGIAVNRETVASELIRERGPQGETYLTAEGGQDTIRISPGTNTLMHVFLKIIFWLYPFINYWTQKISYLSPIA